MGDQVGLSGLNTEQCILCLQIPIHTEGVSSERMEGGGKHATHLLFPALARVAGLGGALALVVGDLGARHGGEGQVRKQASDARGAARGRPAIG
jgi:hypothetical protein